ncbi:hypothetical protein AAZX31_01G030000, partial [Glycine max]
AQEVAVAARKTIQIASAATRTLLSRRSSCPTKLNGLAFSYSSPQKRALSFSRLPVLLVGAQVSLTPLHSATASAMFTSLLSLHNTNWGCLSEGTPLFFLHILDGLTCTIRVALTFHFNC